MLTAEISVLDCCLSWLVAFLAQLNPLEAPVMDTLVAGHIRKVWASSESKCRMRDVHITMDGIYDLPRLDCYFTVKFCYN